MTTFQIKRGEVGLILKTAATARDALLDFAAHKRRAELFPTVQVEQGDDGDEVATLELDGETYSAVPRRERSATR